MVTLQRVKPTTLSVLKWIFPLTVRHVFSVLVVLVQTEMMLKLNPNA